MGFLSDLFGKKKSKTDNKSKNENNSNLSLDAELLEAAQSGNLNKVQKLIEKGANIEARDRNEQTPLMLSLYKTNVEVAKYLIQQGAKINVRNDTGITPLMFAAVGLLPEIVQILLSKGADVNAECMNRQTALKKVQYFSTSLGQDPDYIKIVDLLSNKYNSGI
ncbi:MAG: ankyrin repeat domain-containing protein [Candidatus Methanoperedens sp.]|nr:ankyrin repeat domain-containing protein [Candidatus Methanoperedens sp.]MCZ7395810.1 ankyrin repeat domain-containing protein [Candidatus Methanoperedens sp.]